MLSEQAAGGGESCLLGQLLRTLRDTTGPKADIPRGGNTEPSQYPELPHVPKASPL